MPLLNFQKRFAPLVKSGTKTQTIRAMRKRPFKEGDKLYCYSGLRTKHTEKLGEFECKEVRQVRIKEDYISLNEIIIGREIDTGYSSSDKFARADGFENFEVMKRWFQKVHGLPFRGQLIKW